MAECPEGPPGPGEIRVADVICSVQVPASGRADRGDLELANAVLHVVLRAPEQSLTLRGVGGATVIDATPTGTADAVREVVPLVHGGALQVSSLTRHPDGVTVRGPIVPLLPEYPPDEGFAGTLGEVRYRLAPDDPWLALEGADGVYVDLGGEVETWGEAAFLVGRTLHAGGPRGSAELTDLGGAVIVRGVDRWLVADAEEGWGAWAAPEVTRITGEAPGATSLVWLEGDRVRGRAPISGRVDLEIPAGATTVRAEADGRAPSPRRSVGEGRDLAVGPPGALRVRPEGLGEQLLHVAWTARDGRAGDALVGPVGADLAVGAGAYTLIASAGPAWAPRTWTGVVSAHETRPVGIALEPRFDATGWALLRLDAPASRSRDFRGSNGTAARTAAGTGAAYVVFTPEDLPAGTSPDDLLPGAPVAFVNGATLRSRADGWQVWAWPWSDSGNRALYGGVQAPLTSAIDAAAAAAGTGRGRALRVDLGWLAQVGPPFLADPQPDFVALGPPGGDEAPEWAPWFAWLDASRAVIPTGPGTWVAVPPGAAGRTDYEQPLFRGNAVASTGPVIDLAVDGLPPGEVVPEADRHVVEVAVRGAATLTDVVLLGSAGVPVARLAPREAGETWEGPLPAGWLIAVATAADDPDTWAVTGPVWRAPVP